jgi:hypothetical protein
LFEASRDLTLIGATFQFIPSPGHQADQISHFHTSTATDAVHFVEPGASQFASALVRDLAADEANGEISFAGKGVSFENYKSIVDFDRWANIESRYPTETRSNWTRKSDSAVET